MSNFGSIKRSKADILFSTYIRDLRGNKCEKCGKLGKINGERIAQMEASHYIGRRKRTTRFDTDNVRCLCTNCHKRMGGYTNLENEEYDLFMKEILGAEKYRQLILRANFTGGQKRDDVMELMFVKALISQFPPTGKR